MSFFKENYLNKKHVVITGNFYTSMELAESLLQKGTYLVGQIKSNAKRLDKNWIAIQKEELKNGPDAINVSFLQT